MTIELTTQEADALIQLLDICNKSGGLQVSEACLHFFKKIKQSSDGQLPENPTENLTEK